MQQPRQNIDRSKLSEDDKLLLSIEGLTGQFIVSVNKEAKMYHYKTFLGGYGTVPIDYMEQRLKDGVY